MRDQVADSHDEYAAHRDAEDDLADRQTAHVQEMRNRSRSNRSRAADDRGRAHTDRQHSDRDRRHSEGDRAHAIDDREHSGNDRRRAVADRLHAESDRDHAVADREHSGGDRTHAEEDRGRAGRDRESAGADRHSAGFDELTGARRRGVGLEELANEIQRARRESNGRLVVAFVDVDGLKAVNDAQGHIAGDALLRAVADAFRREMRSYDLLVRIGGDEFVGALPNVTEYEARGRFDRIRTELAESGNTISIGYAELRDSDSADDLIARADRGLLRTRGTARRP